jgi:CHAD domain-containing protein
MVQEYLEREDKYDVSTDFVLPDLGVDPTDRVETTTMHLKATYYDTTEGDLRRHRLTLRRRTGGSDAGWHLKLPAGSARTELQLPAASRSVPRELSTLLLGVRQGRRLVPVVTLETTRVSHVLHAADGGVRAEIADDTVRVVPASSAAAPERQASGPAAWREVEVELGPVGDSDLLETLGRRLIDAGAEASSSVSKSTRALGEAASAVRPTFSGLAASVDDYLVKQYDAIVAGDLALRRDINAIHPTRVAIRRLRSTLRSFAALFDPEAAQHLQSELSWYADQLGAVRDLDVTRSRLSARLSELPPELVVGDISQRFESDFTEARDAAYRRLSRAMNSKRYLAVLAQLDQWRQNPPYTAAANGGEEATAFVSSAEKAMLKRLTRALQPGADVELLHRARRAEKRYRYAHELAEPSGGKKDAILAEAKALQDLLGEFQDSVTSADVLRRLAASARTTAGEDGFTYGVLIGQDLETRRRIRMQLERDYG